MKAKRLLMLVVLMGFIFFLSSYAIAQTKIEAKGAILRIEDKTVVIKNEQGKNVIIKLEDAKGLQIGEKVEIKDGFLRAFDPKTGLERERKKLQTERPT